MPPQVDLPAGPILGVWAHPDDESYCMGGLMAAAVRAGHRVACISATRGEAGSQDHVRWPPEKMAFVREAELRAALGELGVDELFLLDYVDGACDTVHDDEAVAKIAAIVGELQPKLVVTFDEAGGTGHPDHICVSRWASAAFEAAAPAGARLVHMAETPEWVERFKPDFDRYDVFAPGLPFVTEHHDLEISFDLDDDLLDAKMRALHAHPSQTDAVFEMFGEEMLRASHRQENFVLAAKK